MGSNLVGVEAGARTYFGVPASDLDGRKPCCWRRCPTTRRHSIRTRIALRSNGAGARLSRTYWHMARSARTTRVAQRRNTSLSYRAARAFAMPRSCCSAWRRRRGRYGARTHDDRPRLAAVRREYGARSRRDAGRPFRARCRGDRRRQRDRQRARVSRLAGIFRCAQPRAQRRRDGAAPNRARR